MTAVRGIPSLSVPATQNTAPVFEFRCLYTQDIRKKKKVWQDGSLKYHTFNKRVMVWDEQKNYIGDAHWRETVDLEEGAEFSLDRGALVEVGESIGSSVTDLAPLLETVRQHPANIENTALSTNTTKAPQSSRGSTAPRSQWQPKPLSAILGNSQGPIGRARLQTKSPFELRQESRPTPEVSQQRPAKRPRLAVQQENRLTDTPLISGMVAPHSRPMERTPRTSRISLAGDISAQSRQKDFVEISSDNDSATELDGPNVRPLIKGKTSTMQRNRKPAHCIPKPGKARQVGSSKATGSVPDPGKSHKPCKATQSNLDPGKISTMGPNKARVSRPVRVAEGALNVLEHRKANIGCTKGPQSTRLRFQRTRSRRKLMYRDLLPSKPEEGPNALQPRSNYHPNRRGNRRAKRASRDTDLSAIFSSSPLSGFSPPVPTPLTNSTIAPVDKTFSVEEPLPTAIYIDSSPETMSSPTSSTPPHLQATEDVRSSYAGRAVNHQQGETAAGAKALYKPQDPKAALLEKQGASQEASKTPESIEREVQFNIGPEKGGNSGPTNLANPDSDSFEDTRVSPPTATAGESSPVTSKPAMLDQQLIAEISEHFDPTSPLIQRTPQPRPFRRVLSANDSPELSKGHGNGSLALPDPPIQEAFRPTRSTVQRASKSPIKLQKSMSLSEVIGKTSARAAMNFNLPEIDEEPETDEKGAWTAHEAWDLFSWWPEGRQKPDFPSGDRETGQPSTIPCASFTPGFVSAINAL